LILIIGGTAQGKLDFARGLLGIEENDVADGEHCDLNQSFTRPVLDKLHLLIKRLKEQGIEAAGFIMEGIKTNENITIICDELAQGVVPVEKNEREMQELVGRIQCQLAQKAAKVYRVHCSLPVLIKGQENEL